jgi:hypothetical protein
LQQGLLLCLAAPCEPAHLLGRGEAGVPCRAENGGLGLHQTIGIPSDQSKHPRSCAARLLEMQRVGQQAAVLAMPLDSIHDRRHAHRGRCLGEAPTSEGVLSCRTHPADEMLSWSEDTWLVLCAATEGGILQRPLPAGAKEVLVVYLCLLHRHASKLYRWQVRAPQQAQCLLTTGTDYRGLRIAWPCGRVLVWKRAQRDLAGCGATSPCRAQRSYHRSLMSSFPNQSRVTLALVHHNNHQDLIG